MLSLSGDCGHVCVVFHFSEELFVKIPTIGTKKWVGTQSPQSEMPLLFVGNKCLPPKHPCRFSSLQELFRDVPQTSTHDDVAWFHSSSQKNQTSPPRGPDSSSIPKSGRGNQSQMPHLCLGSAPLGLTLMEA